MFNLIIIILGIIKQQETLFELSIKTRLPYLYGLEKKQIIRYCYWLSRIGRVASVLVKLCLIGQVALYRLSLSLT